MGQSLLNYYLPTTRRCCFCISPKIGAMIISILGFIPSVGYLLLYELFGAEKLQNMYYVDHIGARLIIHTYGINGILQLALHIILFIAAIKYIETLILLYLWYMIGFSIIDIIMVCYITFSAIVYGKMISGICLLSLDLLYWIFMYAIVLTSLNGFRRSIHTVVIIMA
ncbi:uncharacterized protein LOC126978518 [Leptidea sinapis]|uniref:uncharacterized protein LOC126978518 n=1 Tax=Leptidea sinapis TaxID=189913 RepID=UPI0021291DCD|nr:uncharacterized protein LOC126978518 [Leptidea sinapis]XP_050683330.1 uncharacterized protein LOC126978518 [Leptidea sinapis]